MSYTTLLYLKSNNATSNYSEEFGTNLLGTSLSHNIFRVKSSVTWPKQDISGIFEPINVW